MKVNNKLTRSIWGSESNDCVHIIDQTCLPFAFETRQLTKLLEIAQAIRAMQVRGAPLIGIAAAFGVALELRRDSSDAALANAIDMLGATRPTAVNLRWALTEMRQCLLPLAAAEANRSAGRPVPTHR